MGIVVSYNLNTESLMLALPTLLRESINKDSKYKAYAC